MGQLERRSVGAPGSARAGADGSQELVGGFAGRLGPGGRDVGSPMIVGAPGEHDLPAVRRLQAVALGELLDVAGSRCPRQAAGELVRLLWSGAVQPFPEREE